MLNGRSVDTATTITKPTVSISMSYTKSKRKKSNANCKVTGSKICQDIEDNSAIAVVRATSNQHLQSQIQLDKMSVHSISSEDISTTTGGKCCSAAARNPAIKTGRRIQLMQVITLVEYENHILLLSHTRRTCLWNPFRCTITFKCLNMHICMYVFYRN